MRSFNRRFAAYALSSAVLAGVGAGVAVAAGSDGAGAALEERARDVRAHRSLAPIAVGAVSVHDPFGSADCGACHASANKEAPGAVADASTALCLKCHDDPGAKDGVPPAHVHGGVGGRCLDCHNPHNSAQPSLLHAPVEQLCASCHADKTRGTVRHEPIGSPESCTKCHLPHGGAGETLLTAAFPSTFYVPYQRDAYALCFSCHDPKVIEEARTTTATKFRDGDRNLHTVHVMRADKGRGCGACHDLHSGARATLVHDDVAFGSHGWRLPVLFAPTDNGASCARTCHQQRAYDRTKR